MVECFERPGEPAPSIMYSIFVESPPQSALEFDDTGPQRMTRRPVMEAAVFYDPAEGAIDIVAIGGRSARDRIGAPSSTMS